MTRPDRPFTPDRTAAPRPTDRRGDRSDAGARTRTPTVGALALAPDSRPAGPPPLRLVPDDERAPLTDRSAWLRRLVQLIAEALAGCRRVEPLRGTLNPEAHAALRRSRGRFRDVTVRPRLRQIRTCPIGPDHVEVSAVLRFGDRYRALALRMDRTPDGWRCTALRAG